MSSDEDTILLIRALKQKQDSAKENQRHTENSALEARRLKREEHMSFFEGVAYKKLESCVDELRERFADVGISMGISEVQALTEATFSRSFTILVGAKSSGHRGTIKVKYAGPDQFIAEENIFRGRDGGSYSGESNIKFALDKVGDGFRTPLLKFVEKVIRGYTITEV
jgi:hypothetical protein